MASGGGNSCLCVMFGSYQGMRIGLYKVIFIRPMHYAGRKMLDLQLVYNGSNDFF